MNTAHFDFGKNWIAFSQRSITAERYAAAKKDFQTLFAGFNLNGKSFLDIGFGQGLSLLNAADAGALVTGCDINPGCVEALDISVRVLDKNIPGKVIVGSILSESMVSALLESAPDGFDIVHSWGVLHHTGNMHRALENACSLVAQNGHLVIAIYNKHWSSPAWLTIKRCYNAAPTTLKRTMIRLFFPVIAAAKFTVTRQNPFRQDRGMDFMFDVIDWIGGYPYEYAYAGEIIAFCERLGFKCIRLISACVPTGCNQFVFRKI